MAWLFEAPAERVIALGRVFLALSSLGAFLIHSEGLSHHDDLTRGLLIAYSLVALGILAWDCAGDPAGAMRARTRQIEHGLDIAVASALLVLTKGPISPYFVLCVFVLVTGALRWDWRGPLISAALLGAVLIGSYAAGFGGGGDSLEVSRLIVRGSFLAVGGFMLSYAAAYRQRSRERLAQLANWPAARSDPEPTSLEPALAHTARVLEVPAVLLLWEQHEEPSLHLLFWQDDRVRYSRERRNVFGDVVPPAKAKRAFIAAGPGPNGGAHLLSRDLRSSFGIETAATAPFETENCRGRVFLINRPSWTSEELALAEIVASRLGIKVEELLLRQKLEEAVSTKERERLGRDLHDGLLQGLAAATMQLRVAVETVPAPVREELDSIRSIISDEAQKIRRFIEETRNRPAPATGVVDLDAELMLVAENSQRRWGCQVALSIVPSDLQCSLSAARSIRHMLNEAISNAVRHGRASRIEADICSREDRIVVSIQDDGIGFVDLDGSYTEKQLKSGNRGPLSLRSRIEELGGVLYLTSTPSGSNITVEFPV